MPLIPLIFQIFQKNRLIEKKKKIHNILKSGITFTERNIEKSIQNFDQKKDHGHMIGVRMLSTCGKSITKLLKIIF